MIKLIDQTTKLTPYLSREIEDAGISVAVDPSLAEDEYRAIKADDYYMGKKDGRPPKCVDYIVAVDCGCDDYALYVLEFKNVNSPRKIVMSEIHEKFATAINDFLQVEFKDIFLNDRFKYRQVKLYLVSDPYALAGQYDNYQEYLDFRERINKKDTLKMDLTLGQKLYKFRRHILRIEFDIPPNPLIRKFS